MYSYRDVSEKTAPSVRSRRAPGPWRGIVMHTTEGTDSLAWLQGQSAISGDPVSCNYLVTRQGDILSLLAVGWYAYHSGRARWQLDFDANGTLNSYYVGIELENHNGLGQKVTTEQYIACAALCRKLIGQNRMPPWKIVGHNQVCVPALRKHDPLAFDWGVWCRELVAPSSEAGYIVLPEVLP